MAQSSRLDEQAAGGDVGAGGPVGGRAGGRAAPAASLWLADQARLPFRPWSGYRALGARWAAASSRDMAVEALRLAGFQLLAVGVFVSMTTAGRLVAVHVGAIVAFWSFAPALQALAVCAVRAIACREVPLGRALALYYAGQGPWMLFLAVGAGVPVVAPGLLVVERFGQLFIGFACMLVLALVWGGVMTHALFRGGLGLSRVRAVLATLLFYATFVSLVVGYYLAMNQIQPQLFGTQ